ncbi:protein of unknown function [Paraburkholderia kururiensis]
MTQTEPNLIGIDILRQNSLTQVGTPQSY